MCIKKIEFVDYVVYFITGMMMLLILLVGWKYTWWIMNNYKPATVADVRSAIKQCPDIRIAIVRTVKENLDAKNYYGLTVTGLKDLQNDCEDGDLLEQRQQQAAELIKAAK